MDPNILAAVIAGSVAFVKALITAVISVLISRSSIRADIANLQLEQKRALTQKLYELRLSVYPEAFDITQDIGKRGERDDKEIKTLIKNARDNLITWHRKRAGLVLSEKSLISYYDLKECLSKQPAHRDAYTAEQLKKIWLARNAFRGCLREDVGLLYEEDSQYSEPYEST